MPLSLAPLGAEQIVRRVSGSGEARSHLEDLGFVPGAPVAVVSTMGGDLIVRVKDARIAISQELANKIIV